MPFEDYKPSVYTPWLRRFFGDERQRERDETRELYETVARLHRDYGVDADAITGRILERIAEQLTSISDPYTRAFVVAVRHLVHDEGFIFEAPSPDFEGMTLKEFADYRNLLQKKRRFFETKDRMLELLDELLVTLFVYLAHDLPESTTPSPFTIPLLNALPKPRDVVQNILHCFAMEPYRERGLFENTRERLTDNIYALSGEDRYDLSGKKRLIEPVDSKLPLAELAEAYLQGTVFHDLLTLPVPLKLTHQDRFSHMHIVGGTGAGKTTLLENLILHDLKSDSPPAIVVIDSQGDLIRKLSKLALWKGRNVVLISPKDVHYPPALNIFDVNQDRLGEYDQATKEQVIAGVIQTFDYLFAGLLGADLTAKQGVFFRYIARLMLSLPDTLGRTATILDMLALMEDAGPYQDAIASLPPIQRNFFERDFQSKTFAQTKEQIRYRLHAIIENPTLARLFTSPTTKVDLFSELNNGSVILVDTAKDFLKGSSAHFGQIFISLVLQAVLERAAIPERQRTDTFLFVDEAAEYFDSNIDDLLTETRKFRCGLVLAHQYLDQATSSLKASLAANTAIKFAAGVSMGDARAMAPDMRTTPDFILSQPRLHFAAHIRNSTPQAVSIPVQVGLLDKEPKLSAAEFDALIERNRARVAYQPDAPRSSAPPPEMSDEY